MINFHDLAVEHGEAERVGDHHRANELHTQLMEIGARLKSEWPANESELLQLLSEKNRHVRVWAATVLLDLREDVAIQALKDIRVERDICSLSARALLDLHQKGKI